MMYGAILEVGDAYLFLGQTQQGKPGMHLSENSFLRMPGAANNKHSGTQHSGNAGLQVKVLWNKWASHEHICGQN